jgi:multiple sugar transport system substrate-binding protein
MDLKNLTKQQKILFGVVGIIVIFAILVILGIIPGLRKNSNIGPGGSSTPEATLEFWGIDKREVFSSLIDAYQNTAGIKINYTQINPNTYEEDLIDALASQRGPDVLMINHNWLRKHYEKLYPIPSGTLSIEDLKNNIFVETVAKDMVLQNKIWGLPLWMDTLALYYNKDIFNNASIALPPATWQEFQNISRSLTEKSITGEIQRAGAAIGTSANIDDSADILALLMLQTCSTITDATGKAIFNDDLGKQAVSFYTSFANPASLYYSWNNNMPESVSAFSQGKVAMIFGYNSLRAEIEKKNPYLNYGIANMPQSFKQCYPGEPDKSYRNYADYWVLAVSATSKNPIPAWNLIFHLVDSQQAKLYLTATGKAPASRVLISAMQKDEKIGVFVKQASTAKSWVQNNPEKNTAVFKNMIESIVRGYLSLDNALTQSAELIR